MEELEFRTAQLGSAGRWAAGDVGVTENEECQLLRITHTPLIYIYTYIYGVYIYTYIYIYGVYIYLWNILANQIIKS